MIDFPLHTSLVAWINKLGDQGLHKEKQIKKFIELKDGIILCELFNYSVSQQFHVSEIELYKDHDDNWAFKLKNLNLLFDKIQESSRQSIDQIEFLSIFNEDNTLALQKLVEEVFSVILISDRKNEFITAIMELDEEDQERLSHFLKKLLKKDFSIYDENSQQNPGDQIQSRGSIVFEQKENRISRATESSEKELLKRIDELEFAEIKEKKKQSELSKELLDLQRKFESITEDSFKKDHLIDRLVKQRDDFFSFLKSNSYEEVIQEYKLKNSRISDLNKIIDELKQSHSENINILQDEITLQDKRMEKFKNYDKMVETVKTLSEENKYVERRASEAERSLEEAQKRNKELSQKVQDKEELMRKKYEQKQLLQKNIELETDLGSKIAECIQLNSDLNELQQLNQKQEESIKSLHKKLQESSMNSEKKKTFSPSRRNLSSDFNEIVNQLERQDLYRKSQKPKSEQYPKFFEENEKHIIEEEEDITPIQNKKSMNCPKKYLESYSNEQNEEDKDVNLEKIELLEEENDRLRAQIKKLQQENAKKQSVSDTLKQINQLSEENSNLQSQIVILSKRLQSSTNESEEEKSKTIKNHQEIIKSLKERLALQQEECKELKETQKTQDSSDYLKQELVRCKKQLEFTRIETDDRRKQLEEEIKLLICLLTETKMHKIDSQNEDYFKTQTFQQLSSK